MIKKDTVGIIALCLCCLSIIFCFFMLLFRGLMIPYLDSGYVETSLKDPLAWFYALALIASLSVLLFILYRARKTFKKKP
jgi:TRAP-type C4-dicarboxylate transport system permease small subunit